VGLPRGWLVVRVGSGRRVTLAAGGGARGARQGPSSAQRGRRILVTVDEKHEKRVVIASREAGRSRRRR